MLNNNKENYEEQALCCFLDGSMSVSELHEALAHVAWFDFSSEGLRSIHYNGSLSFEVEVTVEHVKKRLNQYLRGEIRRRELVQWAAHLMLIDAYVTPGWRDDTIANRYEPMWNIIQQLSVPVIDGEITAERIHEYIQVLNKI